MGRKKSILSSLLSLIVPGLGQIYAGALPRGVALLLAVAVTALLVRWQGNNFLYVGIILAWLWGIWDAYNLARGRQISLVPPFLIIGIVVYIIGWQVTDIKLMRLVTDVADIKPLVSSLLQPAFLERSVEMQKAEIIFESPCSDSPPEKGTPKEDEPYLIILDKTCGEVGETFTIEGGNFWPSSRGQIWWINIAGEMKRRIRQEGAYLTFETDEEGRIPPLTIVVPEPWAEAVAVGVGPQLNRVQALLKREVGSLHLSETSFLVAEKMMETIFLALMATTLAIFFAMPVSFLAARNLMGGNPLTMGVYYLTRTILNILRSIEPLIMAIVFVVWVGLGPFAGVLALSVHSIAALGKLYSEAVESIDPGPIEAITATGANRLQTIVYAVIPQIVPPYVAFTVYRWDINVRMSTIIGFVGGGGIGFLLQQWIRLLMYEEAGAAVWAIAIVVAILDYTSARVREKIV
ncbi:MAG: phosphonate ABC transporter, permease protein PhnE [Anaerolineae bacterium]